MDAALLFLEDSIALGKTKNLDGYEGPRANVCMAR